MDLSKIEAALERIAAALEQIAGGKEQLTETAKKLETQDREFPWDKVSVRIVNALKRKLKYGGDFPLIDKDGKGYTWPLSCEDLMSIGYDRIAAIRTMGHISMDEISKILESYGYIWY